MPIHYPTQAAEPAVFEGRCAPEEADALLDWLRRTPEPVADLAACEDLHMAVAQLLLAARVRIAMPPADRLLAACLGAVALPAVPPPADSGMPQRRARQPDPGTPSLEELQVTP